MSHLKPFNLFRYAVLTLGLVVLAACQPKAEPEMVTLSGQTMGTTYTVKYIVEPSQTLPDPVAVKAEIDKRLQQVNQEMSTYIPSSEISRFNQMTGCSETAPCNMTIAQDFATVVGEAIRINAVTQGALDITVGPVVNMWGFGPDKEVIKAPSPEQLAKVRPIIGIDKIFLHQNTLSKKAAGVYIDLSSIAKGFGVDKIAFYLDELQLNNYLVEIGGELRAKGHNLQSQPWSIGIEHPSVLQHQSNQLVIPLENMAMATSGDYRNFRMDDTGHRLSHIINPQTLAPISHRLASITVVHGSTMTADGLATGLFVLGEQKALDIAEKEHLPVFLIIQTGDKFETKMSSAFKALLKQ
ncbi:FAD:protein FMN transferase [Pelistega europaea]|uniref:FAD:protein FMN transferase n=1 Tax=Pelistega europaea TaxID=106147 RepID=A0A7Y4P4L5_9BURK|nr:FAD:protein FMN transferase [Pelistega europaea]NOL49621.1 FAD:protein FMN transferase [Pelistega europaea]